MFRIRFSMSIGKRLIWNRLIIQLNLTFRLKCSFVERTSLPKLSPSTTDAHSPVLSPSVDTTLVEIQKLVRDNRSISFFHWFLCFLAERIDCIANKHSAGNNDLFTSNPISSADSFSSDYFASDWSCYERFSLFFAFEKGTVISFSFCFYEKFLYNFNRSFLLVFQRCARVFSMNGAKW